MDWKQFTSEIVSSIAWPITVAGIAFLLKDRFYDLIPRLIKLKHKDTELEFSEAIERIEYSASQSLADEPISEDMSAEIERLNKIAVITPRAAITQAWYLVDRQFIDFIVSKIGIERRLKSKEGLKILIDNGLSRDKLSSFMELMRVREIVTSESKVSLDLDQIESYIELAAEVAESIKNLNANM